MTKLSSFLLLIIAILSAPAYSQRDTLFTNMKEINTGSDEYLPFLVDSVLMFTSNRKSTEEGQNLEYSEKVYFSSYKNGTWGTARKDGYKWNSDNNCAMIGMSADYFYFYRSYMNDNGEIFSAKRKLDSAKAWKAQPLQKLKYICTDFDENSIAAGKGDTLYFVSNRSGNYDIYQQVGKNPAQAIDSLNTLFDEEDLFITADAQTIFFSSNRQGGKGDFDIYKATRAGNTWSKPVLFDFPNVNSDSTDRDFRWYNDSTMFFSSNRKGGQGGFDIYMIALRTPKKPPVVKQDTIKKVDSVVVVVPPPPPPPAPLDTMKQVHDELIVALKELGLFPFNGEIQLGAYKTVPSVEKFKQRFTCIKSEKLRMDTAVYDGVLVHKFIINKIYTDVDEAINKQLTIISKHCLPDKDFNDMPFIGLLDKDKKRYAIFWKKEEFQNKNVFYIYKDGKQIWKGKRF